MADNEKGFASRWSERKLLVQQGKNTGDEVKAANLTELDENDNSAVSDPQAKDQLTEADFEDVDFDALDNASDYTRFLKTNVPAAIQKKALRKLWTSDSVFEVLDGMNDYDEDFTGDGLAGRVFRTAHEIGRGFLAGHDDEEAGQPPSTEITELDKEHEDSGRVDAEEDGDTGEIEKKDLA